MFGDTALSSGDKYLISNVESQTLLAVGSTLVVQSVTPGDEGVYVCRAMNDHGTPFAQAFLQPLCEC